MHSLEWINRCSARLKQHWPELAWTDTDDYACDLHAERADELPEEAADGFVANLAQTSR